MRKLIDSNILVYALNSDSGYHSRAVDVLNESNPIFALQNLIETYRVITSHDVEKPMSAQNAWDRINQIISVSDVIYPNQHTYEILNGLTVKYSITSYQVYDAMLVACMLQSGVKAIVTNNPRDFQKYEEIKVIPLVK